MISKFETYATEFVRNIPTETLSDILELTMKKCSLNMGSNYTDEILQRIVELIKEDYSYMTVNLVVSALFRGSMGHFGAGRLIPKTIAQWLRETSQEYMKDKEHRELEAKLNSNSTPVDLRKYPMGTALNLKIDWLVSGHIDLETWDKIPLKQLAEIIGMGETPQLADFGI
jgi:hypothetical protein